MLKPGATYVVNWSKYFCLMSKNVQDNLDVPKLDTYNLFITSLLRTSKYDK